MPQGRERAKSATPSPSLSPSSSAISLNADLPPPQLLVFVLMLISFLIFHLHHLHVWANTVTDAELLTSYKTVLAGLQFNHCSSGSKGQTVGGQWAAEGSILIISLNETGHH